VIRFILSFFGGIFTMLTLGLAAIALSIGAVFWVYGRDLPSHESLAQYQPKTISRIYSGEGRIIDEFAVERRLFAPAEEIPDLVKQAFISAEDKNFYSHAGYDTRGMAAAAVDAVKSRGRDVRGASTITQQVMKNFLLDGSRRVERKIKEIILATRLEETLSKEKILELYLNEIFLGQNSYGVAAAAQTYFNKTLSELAPHEAAMLAAMPQAPGRYHPVHAKERVTERRNYVLREMMENGYISRAVYAEEVEKPLKTVQNGDYDSFKAALPPRDYFTDEIRRQLSRDFGEGEFLTRRCRWRPPRPCAPSWSNTTGAAASGAGPARRSPRRNSARKRRGARRWPRPTWPATSTSRRLGTRRWCWKSARSGCASGSRASRRPRPSLSMSRARISRGSRDPSRTISNAATWSSCAG
jgi:penicillin-binding protein 1A